MKQFSFEAIGTKWWVEIFDEINDKTLTLLQNQCERFCDTFDKKYSRFKNDSLITQLNLMRRLQEPDEECRALLSYGKGLYLRSHGVFNILTGHILEARGYDATYSFTPAQDLGSLPICNPVTDITIDAHAITLTCGNVDLGGYGKGYLIDLLVKELQTFGLSYFLINGGGDMYGTSNHGEAISIYLEHPTAAMTYVAETELLNEGFAASSPFKRQWKHCGTTYSHIVTDRPVPHRAAFVKAKTATDADAFTKSVLLLDTPTVLSLCEEEGISCATFDPSTNELWRTASFRVRP